MAKTIENKSVHTYLVYRSQIKGDYLLLVLAVGGIYSIATKVVDAAAHYGDTIVYSEEKIVNMSYPSAQNPRLQLFVIKLKENV